MADTATLYREITGKSIYKQHEAAFQHVSAYVIAKDGERVATIAFKFSRDGAGRLYAYVHWLGVPMVRGYADGYGYDKRSAACAVAAHKIVDGPDAGDGRTNGDPALIGLFITALRKDDGWDWDRRLRDAGFDVWQAV